MDQVVKYSYASNKNEINVRFTIDDMEELDEMVSRFIDFLYAMGYSQAVVAKELEEQASWLGHGMVSNG